MATEMKVKLSNLKVDNTIEGIIDKAINDKNNNDITNMYFPKSGGVLTNYQIKRDTNDSVLQLCGASNSTYGGFLNLFGSNYSNETVQYGFELHAGGAGASGNTKSIITGFADGRLTHNNNDLAGTAIVSKNLGLNGYVKYSSGLIIQWGRVHIAPNKQATQTAANLPISFSNISYSLTVSLIGHFGYDYYTCGGAIIDASTISVITEKQHTCSVFYIAIGY